MNHADTTKFLIEGIKHKVNYQSLADTLNKKCAPNLVVPDKEWTRKDVSLWGIANGHRQKSTYTKGPKKILRQAAKKAVTSIDVESNILEILATKMSTDSKLRLIRCELDAAKGIK